MRRAEAESTFSPIQIADLPTYPISAFSSAESGTIQETNITEEPTDPVVNGLTISPSTTSQGLNQIAPTFSVGSNDESSLSLFTGAPEKE
jgi:hypothetical protein